MIELVNVFLAAFVAFAAGAGWYMALSEPWMEASGVPRGPDGQPEGGQSAGLLAFGFAMQLIVAGMMRHAFELGGVNTLGKGVVSGVGIGLFFITPWIGLNNSYAGRPFKLTMIDGGYAAIACGLMGAVLTLF